MKRRRRKRRRGRSEGSRYKSEMACRDPGVDRNCFRALLCCGYRVPPPTTTTAPFGIGYLCYTRRNTHADAHTHTRTHTRARAAAAAAAAVARAASTCSFSVSFYGRHVINSTNQSDESSAQDLPDAGSGWQAIESGWMDPAPASADPPHGLSTNEWGRHGRRWQKRRH